MSSVSPRARLDRRPGRFALLAGLLVLAFVVASTPRAALAAPAVQDLTIFAGPGEEYDPLAYAPVGSDLSIDGEAVNGFYPVSFDGTSGWAATWVLAPEAAVTPEVAEVAIDAMPMVEDVAPVVDEVAPMVEETAPIVEEVAPVADVAVPSRGGDITQIITDAALRYGQDPTDMLRVATCESGLDPGVVGAGLYHGLFQFVPSTFAGTPFGDQNIYDPYANANAAAWMWSQGRRGEWVCQ